MRFPVHKTDDEYLGWIETDAVPQKGDVVQVEEDLWKVDHLVYMKDLLAGDDLHSARPATAKLVVK